MIHYRFWDALLGEISTETNNHGILLSALVVRVDSGMPGEGFFILARELEYDVVPDNRGFWEEEREKVWNHDW